MYFEGMHFKIFIIKENTIIENHPNTCARIHTHTHSWFFTMCRISALAQVALER